MFGTFIGDFVGPVSPTSLLLKPGEKGIWRWIRRCIWISEKRCLQWFNLDDKSFFSKWEFCQICQSVLNFGISTNPKVFFRFYKICYINVSTRLTKEMLINFRKLFSEKRNWISKNFVRLLRQHDEYCCELASSSLQLLKHVGVSY